MPFSRQTTLGALLFPYSPDGGFPVKELQRFIFQTLTENKHNRVAIMADGETLEQFSSIGAQTLHSKDDYYWSGVQVRPGRKADKRVFVGAYDEWFRWFMRTQRFRAFNTIVLIDPLPVVSEAERGGYIDGLLTRLEGKARGIVIVSERGGESSPSTDVGRTKEVIRALLFGSRLTRPELVKQLGRTFVPISENTLAEAFTKHHWRISSDHPRYSLDEVDEELLQGMAKRYPPGHTRGEPEQIERLFRRKKRFKRELELPYEMLKPRALEDAGRFTWVTPPFEAWRLEEWLHQLNKDEDVRLQRIDSSHEDSSGEQWLRMLSPTRRQARRVLNTLFDEGKLERTIWYRELGRPAFAYSLPGKRPFLKDRCGQCAFYIPSKRRCSIWHLANQTAPYFHDKWKQPGSSVTKFEIHKMRYASKIGPRSSACLRFIDKKRDHIRRTIPEHCEICGEAIPHNAKGIVTCRNCRTRYVHSKGRIRVMTAYEHEFSRIYHEATGDDAKADFEAYKAKVKEFLRTQEEMQILKDNEDVLAEETAEINPEPPRVWPGYSPILQDAVDRLAQTTDITRRLSIAMAQSAAAATQRIITFAKVYRDNAEPMIAVQQKYVDLINGAGRSKLLPYEAQIMRQYWLCWGQVLRRTPWIWFGPRKRSRFVAEFVGDTAGRARGYSPVDAAINYLHQRRLRQARRINQEVGFPGTCDGFLHRKRYNSRKMGLLFDMIDPFKFADREELLLVILDQGLTWKDFKIETGRRGSNFYYPRMNANSKLDAAGMAADSLPVRYEASEMNLSEAYKRFAANVLRSLERSDVLNPFVFARQDDP